MTWDGWRPGMSGPTIAAAKKALKRKFSWAHRYQLDDSGFFGEDLRLVLVEFQTRKNVANNSGLRTDGVLDWATQVALGLVAPNPPAVVRKKGVILTVHGTFVTMWDGYPADVARAVQDLYDWQPVGNYPATPFPMRKSYQQGVEELVVQCRRHAGRPKVLAGYSQGAIVTSRVWKHEIADPGGRLHDLRDEFVGAVSWGNPDREAGVAHGNRWAGLPVLKSRGITDDRMESTPDWWLDFANPKDLYTDCPDDGVGENATAIWRIVEGLKFTGVNSLLEQVLEVTRSPLTEVVPMFQAIMYAGAFFGGGTKPHVSYQIDPAVNYLRSLARTL